MGALDADVVGAVRQRSVMGKDISASPGTEQAVEQFTIGRLPFVVVLVLVAFVSRAVAAIALDRWLIARGGDGFIFRDDRWYDQLAWLQAQYWHGIGPGVASSEQYLLNFYTLSEAALYFVLGHHPLAMKLVNCLFGALVAGLVFLITRRVFGPRAGVLAGVATAFFPSTFLWSLLNLKETMFLFGAALLLWLLTLLITSGRWVLIVPLLAAFALVGGLRFHIQAMLGLLVPGTVLLQSRQQMPQKWVQAAVLATGCAVLLLFSSGVQFFSVGTEYLNQRRYCAAVGAESAFVPADQVTAAEQCWATDAQPVLDPVDQPDSLAFVARSARELATWLPTGSIYALAAPFPWAADRAADRVTIPEMVLWYGAVVLGLIGFARHWRRWRQYVHLLGYIGAILLMLALTTGNLGTLVRHRGMVIPFVLIFSGAGAAWLYARWRERHPVTRSPAVSTVLSRPAAHR
jgi:Dolichyl-phosphate-mannose-protein mannosyltransferase